MAQMNKHNKKWYSESLSQQEQQDIQSQFT